MGILNHIPGIVLLHFKGGQQYQHGCPSPEKDQLSRKTEAILEWLWKLVLPSHYSRRYAISITDTSCTFISGTGLKISAARWAFLSSFVYACIPNQYLVPPSQSCWEAGVSLPRWITLIKLQSAWPRDYFALFNVNTSEIYLVCVLSCSSYILLFVTLWTIARQAPLQMGFSRQEYWCGLLCPPPRDLPHPGIKPHCLFCLLHWQMGSLPLVPLGRFILPLANKGIIFPILENDYSFQITSWLRQNKTKQTNKKPLFLPVKSLLWKLW